MNPIPTILASLVAVAFVGGLIYLLYHIYVVLTKNPTQIEMIHAVPPRIVSYCGAYGTTETGRRSEEPTLPPEKEKILVDRLITDIKANPDKWAFDSRHMKNGEFEIWLANAPYADMDITMPFPISISWQGAKCLREAKDELILLKLSL